MIGDCLKGILFTTFWIRFLGIAAVIPDPVWDQVPPRLYLSEPIWPTGALSTKKRFGATSSSSVAEEPGHEPTAAPHRERAGEETDMVCSTVSAVWKTANETGFRTEMPNFIPLASVDTREEIPTGRPGCRNRTDFHG